jgi:RNA polymerase sigma-70 factor, ECF subfamily
VPEPDEQRRLLEGFMMAVGSGDVELLNQILAENVSVTGDGGGKRIAAKHPVVGRAAVARFMIGLGKLMPADAGFAITEFNGAPALLLWNEGEPYCVMNFTMSGGQIIAIHNVLNPDKLKHIKVQS